MRGLNVCEVSEVSGGMTAVEGAGMILAVASFAAAPVVLGVAFGAAGGLLAAKYLSHWY
jgi:hypothetical protein